MGIVQQQSGATVVTGAGIPVYQALVLKNAIKLYRNTGMKANRAYTPANMLATAAKITGKAYKRGQLEQAQADLEAWIAERRAAENEQGD